MHTIIKIKNLVILLLIGITLGKGGSATALLYTSAGTELSSRARATFNLGLQQFTVQAPNWVDVVDELVDVELQTLETSPVVSGSGQSNQVVRFQILNRGNGDEAFALSVNNALVGDQFDPIFTSIWLDNGDGYFDSTSDTLYHPGQNEPVLGMTGSGSDQRTLFVLNSMPGSALIDQEGASELSVVSVSGSGVGTTMNGAGDDNTDLVVGFTAGIGSDQARYLIDQATVSAIKSVEVFDSTYGVLTEAIPGATLRYTIGMIVLGEGQIENVIFRDPIPSESTYTTGSLSLNGTPLTDAPRDDAGEFNDEQLEVIARLGRLTAADGEQVIVFETKIKEVRP